MADQLDIAADLEEHHRQQALANRPAAEFKPGVEGDCEVCGYWSGRLVHGACAPCRDKYKLP